jgi:hypothetical protein
VVREKLEHVIKKSDAGRYLVPSPAFNYQPNANAGFFGGAVDRSLPHRTTF